jgi:UDP-glucuronate 4-epimerase
MIAEPGRALVTGAAGFIGSQLSERLVAEGWEVVGIDCFTAFYDRARKESNLEELRGEGGFSLAERDLAVDPLSDLLDGVDTVFHLAAQAGVRGSFGDGFGDYVRHNVQGTQRLLEACVGHPLRRFVYASSSSVYGDSESLPTSEGAARCPRSPYGMTKVATEELAALYHRTSSVPVVGLRYFTVYGPRQRPDMAFSRFVSGALDGLPLHVLGDGRQTRDFTYVEDAVRATMAAAEHGRPGSVYNIGGGTPVSIADVLGALEELVGHPVAVHHSEAARGDVRSTCADGARARDELGWTPRVSLIEGLAAQVRAAAAPVLELRAA